jgi:hypothetical protein
METKTQSEFHVILNGVKLPEETEKKIEKEIQRLVMSELAGYKPPVVKKTVEPKVLTYFFPRQW